MTSAPIGVKCNYINKMWVVLWSVKGRKNDSHYIYCSNTRTTLHTRGVTEFSPEYQEPVLPLSTSTQLNQKELSHILHTALSILQGSILVAFNKGISGTNRDQIVTNNCSPHYGLAAHIKMSSQCHPNNKIFGKNEIIVLRNPATWKIRCPCDSPQCPRQLEASIFSWTECNWTLEKL